MLAPPIPTGGGCLPVRLSAPLPGPAYPPALPVRPGWPPLPAFGYPIRRLQARLMSININACKGSSLFPVSWIALFNAVCYMICYNSGGDSVISGAVASGGARTAALSIPRAEAATPVSAARPSALRYGSSSSFQPQCRHDASFLPFRD